MDDYTCLNTGDEYKHWMVMVDSEIKETGANFLLKQYQTEGHWDTVKYKTQMRDPQNGGNVRMPTLLIVHVE